MTYFKRDVDNELLKWKEEEDRQPLLIRGARQVGKSSAVRNLASHFRNFIEVNFERDKNLSGIFEESLRPAAICEKLSVVYNEPIIAGETLIFLDEIQASLPALSSLRFFYEEMPGLHLIAAGSLLEFAIEEIPSFAVGRVTSLFMFPFSFGEFLDADNSDMLRKAIREASPENPLADIIHKQAIEKFKRFLLLGGMPKVIATYIKSGDLLKCQKVIDNLIISFEDDFAKYKKKVPSSDINDVFNDITSQNGRKFVYSRSETGLKKTQIIRAIDLLVKAGLIIPVTHTSANGLPLGAGVNNKYRKFYVFDTGLFQRMMGLKMAEIFLNDDFNTINKGSIAENSTCMEILKSSSCFSREAMYYWHREAKNSNAEVDFVIQLNDSIIPVEVKSGTRGSMQSMNLFLEEKHYPKGIRISLENFATYNNIDIYPLYAVANIRGEI